ncbi:MAG: AraC family transcriptional regulator, partial [Lentisphaeria bacterium]
WERLVAAWQAGTPAGRLEADGVLRQLLAGLLAATPPCRPPAGARDLARLQPVLEHIQRHPERPLTLAELAGLLHLQPTYFSNLFSRCLGEGPMAYVCRRRIELAQGLLRTTPLPLKEIAGRAGFRDVYYFSRMFRRVTGTPPAAFRRQAGTVVP